MTVDSENDLAGLRAIGRIVALTLQEMAKYVHPGVTTLELDRIGEGFLQSHGARSAPRLVYNFPGGTCISLNEEAAHGIPGDRRIRPGDMVNIDVSAEKGGYFADAAMTIPVMPVTPLQERLCRCSRSALEKAIRVVSAGLPLNVIGKTIEAEAKRCGFHILRDLGGHGVGRSIHEEPRFVPNYADRREKRRLEEGMVLTVEPFLTTGATNTVKGRDGWTLRTPDGSLSVQYEHTLVVTRGEPIIITAL